MFTFNGIDFSTLVDVQEVDRPLIAPQLISTSTSAGVAGTRVIRKVPQAFNIKVKFTLKESNPRTLRAYIREIADKLDTDKPSPLIFHDEDDKYINAMLSDDSSLEQLAKYGVCTINFYCNDPYWYAISDDIVEFSGDSKTFTRKGTATSYPVIEITGTNAEGTITIESDHHRMVFDGTLKAGETLVVDSELLTAKIIGEDTRSAINNLDKLDFIVLGKGTNTVKVLAEGGATVTHTKITCNSRWK